MPIMMLFYHYSRNPFCQTYCFVSTSKINFNVILSYEEGIHTSIVPTSHAE